MKTHKIILLLWLLVFAGGFVNKTCEMKISFT